MGSHCEPFKRRRFEFAILNLCVCGRGCSRYGSRSMASNCTAYAAERSRTVTYVDMGLPGSETHTEFSPRAELAAANAFVDFLLLLDAKMIIRTSSSFSGTISSIKGLECRDEPSGLSNPLSLCLPADC